MFKNFLLFFIKIKKPFWLKKVLKILPNNFSDLKGNNLFHYSALFHSEALFLLALENSANINHLNKAGYSPLHEYIKNAFILMRTTSKNGKIVKEILFKNNKLLLNYFLENGANVNIKRLNKSRDGQWAKPEEKKLYKKIKAFFLKSERENIPVVLTNSRSNHMETPIEILINLFWVYWEHIALIKKDIDNLNEEWEESLKEYYDIYNMLSDKGANINLLLDGGTFFDLKNEAMQDAMQFTNKYIVSHFFMKYVCKNIDLEVIKPLLSDKNLEFDLLDEYNNNVLHILFGRISSSVHRVNKEKVNEILFTILENPSFKSEYLEQVNNGFLTPVGCFKNDTKEFRDILNSYLLRNKLNKTLKSTDKRRKTNKL